MSTPEKINDLEEKLKNVSRGDPVRIEKQHNAGKMTARERITTLLDSESFAIILGLLLSLFYRTKILLNIFVYRANL